MTTSLHKAIQKFIICDFLGKVKLSPFVHGKRCSGGFKLLASGTPGIVSNDLIPDEWTTLPSFQK